MMASFLLSLAVILKVANAGVIFQTYTPPNANCVDYNIPVSISTQGTNWTAPEWTDNVGLIDYLSLSATRTSANLTPPAGEAVNIQGQYTISATFCSPKTPTGKSGNVLLATHGLGYTGTYWNSAFQPEKYNFVQYAISQGYSVFFYDRLGTGNSSKLSGFMNQGPIQVDILIEIANKIRAGNYTGTIGAPKKLILVGHSYGSAISFSTVAEAPNVADAVVLTGLAFAQNGQIALEAMAPRIASTQNAKWNDLDAGYLTWADIWANINCFFKEPTYSLDAIQYVESIKAPLAVHEFTSIAGFNSNATAFKGSVFIQNGEYDFLVCNGYCPGVNNQPAQSFFSGVKAFKATIVPNTGHALNYHTNAIESYQSMVGFLNEQGL